MGSARQPKWGHRQPAAAFSAPPLDHQEAMHMRVQQQEESNAERGPGCVSAPVAAACSLHSGVQVCRGGGGGDGDSHGHVKTAG